MALKSWQCQLKSSLARHATRQFTVGFVYVSYILAIVLDTCEVVQQRTALGALNV